MIGFILVVVGALGASLIVGLVVSIALAIRKRLKYARKRIAIATICRDEMVYDEVRRGLAPPPRNWAVSIDFEEGDKPLIFLQMRGESAKRVVDSIIPRLQQIGVNDYSFIAGPVAEASAEEHYRRKRSFWVARWPDAPVGDQIRVYANARVIKRVGPGRKLAILRWFCGAETRELIDIVCADLARDRREMEAEGRSRAFIWIQQTVVEWREIVGIAYRFAVRIVIAANPLARLIDRQ